MATTRGTKQSESDQEPTVSDVSGLSYADAGAELDSIIEEFETGAVDVDRLVDQLERATEIVDELDHRLRRTRMRVEELVPRLESVGQSDPGSVPPDDDEEVEFVEVLEEVEITVVGDEGETPPGLF